MGNACSLDAKASTPHRPDLQKDASEMNNLYGKKGYENITQQLMQQLRQLATEYEDEDGDGDLLGGGKKAPY